MACTIFFDPSSGDLDCEPIIKKSACIFVDALLYPVISVICAVAFAILLLLKLLFLLIAFPFKACVTICSRTRDISDLKKHFKCLYSGEMADLRGALLIIPIIGTVVHGALFLKTISDFNDWEDKTSKGVVFMQIPIMQLAVTAGVSKS
ncbi:hypothetical protein [Candidatus Chlamydia corallus]|uniref:hypothetical protein n=1 Tax=Candidatus Chlamydia corallus TaxID=2038470 RepID=UPI000C2FDE6F|nr:hypothetical protein [Candidatus Chlamydia corallus]